MTYTPEANNVVTALANLRGLSDEALYQLLEDAYLGTTTEAVEWAVSRLADLDAAREALESLLIASGQTGGLVSVRDAADQAGVTYSGLARKLERRGVQTVEAPRSGAGPRMAHYIRRADLDSLWPQSQGCPLPPTAARSRNSRPNTP